MSWIGNQYNGCLYYKSLGACGEGTEKACHYLLIRGRPRERAGDNCCSRQGKKNHSKKDGGRKDVGHRTSGPDVPDLRRR